MATRAFLAVISNSPNHHFISPIKINIQIHCRNTHRIVQCFSSDTNSSAAILQPPDISRLAETARISLTPSEIEECGPKIRKVIDWFGQLQQIDVNSVEPAIRAEMEGGNLREDAPETFENSESIRDSLPSFEDPYLKVPKVLNKE